VPSNRDLQLDLPTLALVTRSYPLTALHDWQEAVTVTPTGTEYGRGPIAAETVHAVLPDGYVGPFEVHLLSADGARTVACEGRRLPPLADA
jgi:hypothetical protein